MYYSHMPNPNADPKLNWNPVVISQTVSVSAPVLILFIFMVITIHCAFCHCSALKLFSLIMAESAFPAQHSDCIPRHRGIRRKQCMQVQALIHETKAGACTCFEKQRSIYLTIVNHIVKPLLLSSLSKHFPTINLLSLCFPHLVVETHARKRNLFCENTSAVTTSKHWACQSATPVIRAIYSDSRKLLQSHRTQYTAERFI